MVTYLVFCKNDNGDLYLYKFIVEREPHKNGWSYVEQIKQWIPQKGLSIDFIIDIDTIQELR